MLPSVRGVLFESAGRAGYGRLKSPLAAVKPAILGHAEFAAFQQKATKGFADWRKATTPRLTGFDKGGHPKALIETIGEDLLAAFRQSPLLDATLSDPKGVGAGVQHRPPARAKNRRFWEVAPAPGLLGPGRWYGAGCRRVPGGWRCQI